MDYLIPKFDRLQRALAGLTPARRMLAGALVAVMIATGVWAFSRATSSSAARYGADGSEMEPVLDQAFTKDDLDRIAKHLRAESIPCEVADGRVFVRADRRLDALSGLFYSGILGGGGTESGFDAMIKQMSTLDAPSKTDKLFTHYREQKVVEVVNRYPGVRKTTVSIDPTVQRHLGGDSVLPTAMIDIQTRGDGSANPRQLSQAAVNVLTGVVANLSRERVRVTIDGATYNTPDAAPPDGDGAGDLLERKQKAEQLHVAKVRQLLSHIPGEVLVSVSVDVDVPLDADDADDADGLAKGQAAEAAVVANAVPVMPDLTRAAKPIRVESVRSAAVAIPRSYFLKIYRRANTGTQEPTDALLQPVVDAYALKIRNLVRNALGLTDDAVSVEPYEDALPAAMEAAAAIAASSTVAPVGASTAGSTSPPVALITRNLNAYAREIAFVTMGAVALTALSLAVRRRTPAPRPVMADALGRRHAAGDPQQVVNGTLDDIDDRDDQDYASGNGGDPHQLFRRVRDMAQEHPDDAARVLRSWIYQQD